MAATLLVVEDDEDFYQPILPQLRQVPRGRERASVVMIYTMHKMIVASESRSVHKRRRESATKSFRVINRESSFVVMAVK